MAVRSAEERPSALTELSILWATRAASGAIMPFLERRDHAHVLSLRAALNAGQVETAAAVDQPL